MASLVEQPNPVQMAYRPAQPPQMGALQQPQAPVARSMAPQSGFNPQNLQSNAWQSQWANIPQRGPGQMPGAAPLPTWNGQRIPGFADSMGGPRVGPAMQPPPPSAALGAPVPPPLMGMATGRPLAPGAANGLVTVERPGMQQGMQGGMMSDETAKVIQQRSLADDFLDHMRPYSYKYKDPANEPREVPTGGTYMGVMAQDLERVPELGHQLVMDTPQGKMVDPKTALSATLGGLARLNERVRALESDTTRGGGR